MDFKEQLDKLAILDHKVPRVKWDGLDCKEHRAIPVSVGQRDLRGLLEHLDQQDPRVL